MLQAGALAIAKRCLAHLCNTVGATSTMSARGAGGATSGGRSLGARRCHPDASPEDAPSAAPSPRKPLPCSDRMSDPLRCPNPSGARCGAAGGCAAGLARGLRHHCPRHTMSRLWKACEYSVQPLQPSCLIYTWPKLLQPTSFTCFCLTQLTECAALSAQQPAVVLA